MSVGVYPSYKSSGVNWLDSVPSHWTLRRLGYYLGERRERVSDRDFPALSVTKNGVVPQLDTAAKTDDGDNRKRVCNGDFVINSRSDRKGSSGRSSLDGSVSLINIVLYSHQPIKMEFVGHLLRSATFQEEFYRYGKGIVADLWSTNFSEMRNIMLAVPPTSEQSAIVSFLDRETGKIDALMAQQQQLIALLKEKRQAVISHVVTKGLDLNVPMKDSGVAWLGKVPSHWRLTRLGRACKLRSGFAFSATEFRPSGIVVIRMNNLRRGKLDLSEAVCVSENVCVSSAALSDGDLLWGMSGSIGETGSLGNYARVSSDDLPCQLNQRVGRFEPDIFQLEVRYLECIIQANCFTEQVTLLTSGTAQFNISPEQVESCIIALPPVAEQRRIFNYIEARLAALSELSQQAKTAVALLRERRAALISAAVTGKIDVRDHAPAAQAAAA